LRGWEEKKDKRKTRKDMATGRQRLTWEEKNAFTQQKKSGKDVLPGHKPSIQDILLRGKEFHSGSSTRGKNS